VNRPSSLKVGAKVYDVFFDKKSWKQRSLEPGETKNGKEEDRTMGRTDHVHSKIWISPDMSEQEKRATLVHEVLHCLCWDIGVPISSFFKDDHDETEEAVVSILEPRLFAVLVDNPILFAYVAGVSEEPA